jgi:hypothetical protein
MKYQRLNRSTESYENYSDEKSHKTDSTKVSNKHMESSCKQTLENGAKFNPNIFESQNSQTSSGIFEPEEAQKQFINPSSPLIHPTKPTHSKKRSQSFNHHIHEHQESHVSSELTCT